VSSDGLPLALSAHLDRASAGRRPGRPRLARPYMIAGGRTKAVGAQFALEALVWRTPQGERRLPSVQFEHRDLLLLSSEPVSIAELAARLRVPVGVAGALIEDLADEGLVTITEPVCNERIDIELLERVLHGLRAI
jgi:Protein of unknown function (DUF742)